MIRMRQYSSYIHLTVDSGQYRYEIKTYILLQPIVKKGAFITYSRIKFVSLRQNVVKFTLLSTVRDTTHASRKTEYHGIGTPIQTFGKSKWEE